MSLAQIRLYLEAAEIHEGRAFRRTAIAARSAWLNRDDFKKLIDKLPA